MAEGWARKLLPPTFSVYSAGTRKHGLNPLAVQAMAEVGVDISGHESKTVGELGDIVPGTVITLCGDAHETCPVFPGKARVVHHGFDDPPTLAVDAASNDEAMEHYRRVRDEIRDFVETLPAWLSSQAK